MTRFFQNQPTWVFYVLAAGLGWLVFATFGIGLINGPQFAGFGLAALIILAGLHRSRRDTLDQDYSAARPQPTLPLSAQGHARPIQHTRPRTSARTWLHAGLAFGLAFAAVYVPPMITGAVVAMILAYWGLRGVAKAIAGTPFGAAPLSAGGRGTFGADTRSAPQQY